MDFEELTLMARAASSSRRATPRQQHGRSLLDTGQEDLRGEGPIRRKRHVLELDLISGGQSQCETRVSPPSEQVAVYSSDPLQLVYALSEGRPEGDCDAFNKGNSAKAFSPFGVKSDGWRFVES